jgi:Abnormal spindle-like microcephaly-assoc'd, ASPM-SPD-2-Hydin
VSNIYGIFSFSCCVGLAPADTFGDGSSPLKKGLHLQAGAKMLRFDQVGRAFLFVLACCLIVAMSGCGAGVSKSLGGGLLVSPGTINFGSVPVGHVADSNVNVSNSSSSSIVISQVSISGQTFSVLGGSNMPISVPAGGTSTLKIGFTPVSAVSYSGQLTLMDPSAQSIAQVPMQGQGFSQAAPELTISAASLSFGGVTVNTATTQSVTLTSTGTSPVTVNLAAITGAGFTIVGGSLPATLNPTQSMTLQVQFDPTSPGAASGQLAISSNSTSGNATVVNLSGTGTTATSPQTSPLLTISAASLSFGSVTVNTATTQSLTLTSTGTSPVTVNSAAVSGAGFAIVGGSLPVTLNPTQSTTLQVQFNPTSASSATGQLSISSNSSSGNTAIVVLNGTSTTAPSPQLTISAATLSFGSVTVNTATTQSLTLTSNGTSPLTVNSAAIAGTGFTIIGGSLPVILNPTQSMTLQVQYKPTVTGAASGQITITSNSSSGSTAVVALSGTSTTAPSPQLTINAATLSFGNVTVNTATTQSLTLTSTGTSPLTVNSAAISGAAFTIVGGSLPVTLNPTQSMTLQVQFDPTSTGTATEQLSISSDSSSGNTAIVALSGTSTTAPSPQLTISAATLSFGNVTVNTATTQSLTLTSTGTSPVTVNSASITGAGYTVVGGTLPAMLNPTQSMTLQVQLLPTTTGAKSGQITVSSNSSTGSTAAVALSGTGTIAASPQLTVSAASLSFGSVATNSAATASVTLTSTGTSALTVNGATITGAGFTIVAQSFPVTLNPTQSLTLQVQFKPATAGASTGQLTISSNSTTGSTAVVALSGTGTAANPQLTVSATSLGFGNVALNTATTLTLTLTSSGTTPVTVNSVSIAGAGLTIVGGGFPVTIDPTQTLLLQLQFKPTIAGAITGQLTINSNSTTGSSAVVALSGNGTTVSHEVDLSWNAPTSSPDPVAGYNIYRSTGGGSLVLVNSSPNLSISYIDSAVVSGSTYSYIVKSVDFSGIESDASNQTTATIP